MSNIAIRVENLSKRYRIGVQEESNQSFARTVGSLFTRPVRNFRRLWRLSHFQETATERDIIWALRNVSFEVKEGEVLGVIGPNGAGKSTLLKILTRITEPTEGYVAINGRVGSLLEVGTGFHPELTGRDNVYLNGTILGMTRREIDGKFDAIVDFSGVEGFIDTPVKRYSTGMRVRLAFAVAAHLEPEILLVDEVLAVGDIEFQNRCIGKMNEVATGGRTVVVVSHNMGLIGRLCTRAILINDGRVELTGDCSDVIREYLTSAQVSSGTWDHRPSDDCCTPEARLKSAKVSSLEGVQREVFRFDQPFRLEISYEVVLPKTDVAILMRLSDSQGNILWTSWDIDTVERGSYIRESGHYVSGCRIPGGWLRPGRYFLSIGSHNGTSELSYHENVVGFDISQSESRIPRGRIGVLTPLFEWTIEREDARVANLVS